MIYTTVGKLIEALAELNPKSQIYIKDSCYPGIRIVENEDVVYFEGEEP